MADVMIDPDCASGKHWNCTGESWDNELDASAPCPCVCHETYFGDIQN